MIHSEIVTLAKFNRLLSIVVSKIQADSKFRPDTLLALSTGGFPVAAALAKRLGVRSRDTLGLPVYKDSAGDYHLDNRFVRLGRFVGRQVLVVDEASNRGLLTKKVVRAVMDRGGIAKSCVLIASRAGIQPDYVAETCIGNPPKFYWESVV